jgi:RNase P subunit RPR2
MNLMQRSARERAEDLREGLVRALTAKGMIFHDHDVDRLEAIINDRQTFVRATSKRSVCRNCGSIHLDTKKVCVCARGDGVPGEPTHTRRPEDEHTAVIRWLRYGMYMRSWYSRGRYNDKHLVKRDDEMEEPHCCADSLQVKKRKGKREVAVRSARLVDYDDDE